MRKALVALTLLLAGCTGATDDGGADPLAGHDLDVVLADALALYNAGNATANLVRLGHFAQSGAEADPCGRLLFVDQSDVLRILDVHDPSQPTEVGNFTGPVIEDVKVSDDCKWAFLGNDDRASGTPLDAVAPRQGTGTGDVGEGGFYVIDVSDPAAPKQASVLKVGGLRGPHMVFYHNTTDGRELVFGANADISINSFDRASGTLTELARYTTPLEDFNREPEVVDAYYQGTAHDMFVMNDPVEQTTLMYVANWDAGLRIVDLTDPATPVERGTWNDFPEGHEGNLHTVATEWIGDRRITVGTVEVGFSIVGGYHYAMGTDRSILYVWDTTDLDDVVLLGTWENPAGEPSGRDLPVGGSEITSTHNFQLEHGRVYMAHYGFGVFVLDVSTPANQAAPALVAFHKEEGDHVWDVVLNDGIMYSSGAAGVVSMHFPRDVVGPTGIDSRA